MTSSKKLLTRYVNEVIKNPSHPALWVFDFDDTLVKTDAVTHVTTATGHRFDLTPGEFAVYEKKPGEVMDFTDFQKLINPRPIKWVNRLLRTVYDYHGPRAIMVLSARTSDVPIHEYLADHGYDGIDVVALNNPSPVLKSLWVDARIRRDALRSVEFFDDSHKNVAAIEGLREVHACVTIRAHHIVHNRIASLRLPGP